MPSTELVYAFTQEVKKLLEKYVESKDLAQIKLELLVRDTYWWTHTTRECARCAPEEVTDLFFEAYIAVKNVDLLITELQYLTSPATMNFLFQISKKIIEDPRVTKEMAEEFVAKIQAIPHKEYLRAFCCMSLRTPISLRLHVYEEPPKEKMDKINAFTAAGYSVKLEKHE